MKSNPTTGYMWQIDELYLNKQMLKFENKEYKSDNNENKLVGAGGVEVWIFKALQKGETCFSMIYLRDFEKKEIAKTKNIKVIIE